jgi:hypothetical protein
VPREANPIEPSDDRQPGLFSDTDLPTLPQLVAFVKAKRYEHTGGTLVKAEQVCMGIATDLIEGLPMRTIARRWHVSRQSIWPAMEILEEQGKLEPLKQRLSSAYGLAITLSVENLVEKLENGSVPANVLPIAVGVLSDKKALIDGGPTERIEAGATALPSLAVIRERQLALRDRLREKARIAAGKTGALDVQSVVSEAKPQ